MKFVSNTYLVGDQEVIRSNFRDFSDLRAAERLAHTHQEATLYRFQDMVVALVSLSEGPGPYTAGHQERVADLAVAMAVEMGLGDQQIEGIQISALMHDIGKFAIPSEILTMPSALPLAHNVDRCTGPGGWISPRRELWPLHWRTSPHGEAAARALILIDTNLRLEGALEELPKHRH